MKSTCIRSITIVYVLMLVKLAIAIEVDSNVLNACPSQCKCNDQLSSIRCSKLSSKNLVEPIFLNKMSTARSLSINNSNLVKLNLTVIFEHARILEDLSVVKSNVQQIHLNCNEVGNHWKQIRSIDLCGNELEIFNITNTINCLPFLSHLYLKDNVIRKVIRSSARSLTRSSRLQFIDMENNLISNYKDEFNTTGYHVTYINLGSNQISQFSMLHSSHQHLQVLNLSNNAFSELTEQTLSFNSTNLVNLRKLDLSDNKHLISISVDVSVTLSNLSSVTRILVNRCSKLSEWTWAPGISKQNAPRIEITHSVNWNCTCNNAWLSALTVSNKCNALNFTKLGCKPPTMDKFVTKAHYGVGEAARLHCSVSSIPPAHVVWTVNNERNYTLTPQSSKLRDISTESNLFHIHHPWHWQMGYFDSEDKFHSPEASERVIVLKDGSLYIDFVTYMDKGTYKCKGVNFFGSIEGVINFTLKNSAMRDVRNHSFIVAGICTGGLLTLGMFVGLVRFIARKCSKEEREKQKSIRDMLEHLESYRGAKMEQFKEYKDWFRAARHNQMDNYNARVLKMKDGCVNNMVQMQESYNKRIGKIKEQCDIQMEKVRESYNNQMLRIKDYKSHHVERVRENYNQQLIKIKEYATFQLEKLREQYKAQQAYLMKMMESMHIENCIGSDVEGTSELQFKLDLSCDDEISDTECENIDLLLVPIDVNERRPSSDVGDDEFLTATDLNSSVANICELDDFNVIPTVSAEVQETGGGQLKRTVSAADFNSRKLSAVDYLKRQSIGDIQIV